MAVLSSIGLHNLNQQGALELSDTCLDKVLRSGYPASITLFRSSWTCKTLSSRMYMVGADVGQLRIRPCHRRVRTHGVTDDLT